VHADRLGDDAAPARLVRPDDVAFRLGRRRRGEEERILEVDAGSYIAVENQLVREEDWAHFYQSEIDLLDAAAERLFPQLRP
jgi:hypothetical protein